MHGHACSYTLKAFSKIIMTRQISKLGRFLCIKWKILFYPLLIHNGRIAISHSPISLNPCTFNYSNAITYRQRQKMKITLDIPTSVTTITNPLSDKFILTLCATLTSYIPNLLINLLATK